MYSTYFWSQIKEKSLTMKAGGGLIGCLDGEKLNFRRDLIGNRQEELRILS
jgi:hypothetical protein